ncbi:MAG: hypothetical protein B6241_14155 [Spirochaetaceae bacterium 4572_59]|nr:MAG: hypothetical protein B6241_14155 [Spirochaetaceae bacterium 4572_59]
MKGRLIVLITCLAVLFLINPLWSEQGSSESREGAVRRGAQISAAVLGISTVTLYAVGPFTGMDFEDHPVASASMILTGSAVVLAGSYLCSTLFADVVLKSRAGPVRAGLEGLFAGALAGGITNGTAFAAMFAIGVPSGVIEFNEPMDKHLDTWYKAASLGFLGGFMHGMVFGALAGSIGGTAISFTMGF